MKFIIALSSILAVSLITGCATNSSYKTNNNNNNNSSVYDLSPVTLLAVATVKSNREHSAWMYCDANENIRLGELEIGRHSSSALSSPSPRSNEYVCGHVHTHPWEGANHALDVTLGPSPQDLAVSMRLPRISFFVIDRAGMWPYSGGQIHELCPWTSDYSTTICTNR